MRSWYPSVAFVVTEKRCAAFTGVPGKRVPNGILVGVVVTSTVTPSTVFPEVMPLAVELMLAPSVESDGYELEAEGVMGTSFVTS
jgi:hypothetical protein